MYDIEIILLTWLQDTPSRVANALPPEIIQTSQASHAGLSSSLGIEVTLTAGNRHQSSSRVVAGHHFDGEIA